jgi:hypothetical protein
VPAGSSIGGNYVPTGQTVDEAYPEIPNQDRASAGGRGVSAEAQALIDNDLAAILANPSLTERDKARFEDMAGALSDFGAVEMAGNGPKAVRFAGGSKYGGDMVPGQFRAFTEKVENDARRRGEETSAVVQAAVQTITENPELVKKSRFARLLGR